MVQSLSMIECKMLSNDDLEPLDSPSSEVLSPAHQSRIRLHVPAALAAETEDLLWVLPRVSNVSPIDESPGWFAVEMINLSDHTSAYLSNHILEALLHAHIPILTYDAETVR